MTDGLKVTFFGGLADEGQLNLYDAGRSLSGLGRTVSILSEFYRNGRIIVQAPSASSEINLKSSRSGSFTLEVAANVAGAIIAVPFVIYLTYIFQNWLPNGAAEQKAKIERLQRRLSLVEARSEALESALSQRDKTDKIEVDIKQIQQFISQYPKEHDVLRSITAGSFVEIFRPVGRSAKEAVLYGSTEGVFSGLVDADSVAKLDSDVPGDEISTVRATVTAFSRNSKTGIAMSSQLGRGFRFHSGTMGKLGKEDDFSWSQYRQIELLMTGRFYYFFDGSIKKLEVYSVERTDPPENGS